MRVGEIAQGRAGLPPDPKLAPLLGVAAEEMLRRRKLTHRAGTEDGYRWRKHLAPHFAHRRPAEVDDGVLRRYVEEKLEEGCASGSVRIYVSLLSSLFDQLLEDKQADRNPCRGLPRSIRRLLKPSYDPRTTPFIERLDDVKRIFADLPEPVNVAYAIGAFGGLRTGEVLALKWLHVDLAARRIHVRESIDGPLKGARGSSMNAKSRIVPILDPLVPVLKAWKLKTGGTGLVVPPMRVDGGHLWEKTPNKYLQVTLKRLGLNRDGLDWYEATRHTFASQWVLNNGSIEKLKEILGHYSVVVTERYAHLRPDLFAARDFSTISIDLAPAGEGTLQALPGPDNGQQTDSRGQISSPKVRQ
jgi:integrase